jgi:hypothetical protein
MQIDLKKCDTGMQDAKTKSVWHCPTINRIDIKRTLVGHGSNIDAIHGPTPGST